MSQGSGPWGLVSMAVGIFILVTVVGYSTMMTTEIQKDINVNATENPVAADAVDEIFGKAYKGMKMMGNVITLQVIGAIIFIVAGFAYIVRR